MADEKKQTGVEMDEHACDVRVWCPSCQHNTYTQEADKYLCDACGKIMELKHEMHHEHFPHLSGDKDDLS